ncbi:hypothetical protein ACFVH6_20010 [Spirillospora sp. NPDC127200]
MRVISTALALLGAAAALPLLTTPAQAAAACGATTTKWAAPVVVANSFHATSINDSGQIVGHLGSAGHNQQAVLWQAGSLTKLPALFGGKDGKATDIDDQGRITGTSKNILGRTHAVTWQNGKIKELGPLTSPESRAAAISNGQVAGTADADDGSEDSYARQRAVRWSLNGTRIDLHAAQQGSVAVDINAAGRIAGTQNVSRAIVESPFDREHQAFITNGDSTRTIGTLGGTWSEAVALSDDDQVVGMSALGPGGSSAAPFSWTVETGMKRLAELGGEGRPVAVNKQGTIAGQLACANEYGTHDLAYASVWENADAEPLRLPKPEGNLSTKAIAMNDNGDIVGEIGYPAGAGFEVVVWKKTG